MLSSLLVFYSANSFSRLWLCRLNFFTWFVSLLVTVVEYFFKMSAPRPYIEVIVNFQERVPINFWDRFDFLVEGFECPLESEKVPGDRSSDSFDSAGTISLREYFRTYCPAECSEDLGKSSLEVLFV